MRIVFYISHIGSGGAARVLTILANQFSDNGNEVFFVTNFKAQDEYFLNGRVQRVFLEKMESRENFLKKNMHRISVLRKVIKKYKPDVVISFMHENDGRAYLATRGLKTKLILSVRNDPASKFTKVPIKQVAQYIYSHCDAVVFQTQRAKEWFHNVRGTSKIIYNPVDEKFFNTVRSSTPKDIVTMGKFLEQKNHMMLIKAFELIADKVTDNLVIYGDGKLRKKYEEYIKENNLECRIFLPGSTSDVPGVLSKAKLFVMSSNYEGMPNSLMEAMTVGVPCISTDCPCGGPKELMTGDMVRNLVPCGDYKALAQKMLDVMNEASDSKNEEYVKSEKFRSANIYKEWEKLVEEIIKA